MPTIFLYYVLQCILIVSVCVHVWKCTHIHTNKQTNTYTNACSCAPLLEHARALVGARELPFTTERVHVCIKVHTSAHACMHTPPHFAQSHATSRKLFFPKKCKGLLQKCDYNVFSETYLGKRQIVLWMKCQTKCDEISNGAPRWS